MGAGNADGIFVGLHDLAPGLCPLKHRDTGSAGCGNLRIVVVGSGGADDAVSTLEIFCLMADDHGNALGDQLVGGSGGGHVGAGNGEAHALEHQAQGAHGNAADADQMDMMSRCQIFFNVTVSSHVS